MLFLYLTDTVSLGKKKTLKICNFAGLKKYIPGFGSLEVLQRLKSLVSICAPEVPEMSPKTLDLQHIETFF